MHREIIKYKEMLYPPRQKHTYIVVPDLRHLPALKRGKDLQCISPFMTGRDIFAIIIDTDGQSAATAG